MTAVLAACGVSDVLTRIVTRGIGALLPSATTRPRIVDEFGDPVADVQVMVLRPQYVNAERRMVPAGGRPAATNDLGDYRIFGLAPGQYFVTATLRNLMMMGDTDDRSGYAPTYYPGTGSVGEAQRITVAAGQTASGTNLTLLPVRTSRISGRALDADGKPLVGGMVMAMERMGAGAFMMGFRSPAQVRADGSFTLSGITPGQYILRVGGPGAFTDATTVAVTVSDGDLTDVQLIAAKPSVISGRILLERGATPPRASALQLFASSSEPMMGGGQARVNDDFTFELKVPTGHYNIRTLGPPEGWYLHAVRLNGLDITDSGIEVAANASIAGVEVEMTAKPSGASGTIVDENGRAIRDAWAVIFSQDAQRWTQPTRYITAGRPDVNNVFKLNVPAGDYFVAAVADVEPGEWNDPEFLTPLRERATRVTIAEGERKTVDLKLAR